ncbi:acyl carrier protein [Bacillus sp. 166amftsu]|uniref:acyl carrier protein n=1 Tax=Bacillus sp. 166amftsu TaxID=1761753 RepID=UPI00089D7B21|nr:acyl carrier protein [Bacillus sp. 166amftsu]SDZ37798.1 Phosphopantetheine attachment site [Bacillus sp. 166amftsu]
MESTKHKILSLLSSEHSGVFPIEQIQEHLTLFEIGFDSVRYMEFIVLVEEMLNIEYPDNLLDIDSSMTVREIISTVLTVDV